MFGKIGGRIASVAAFAGIAMAAGLASGPSAAQEVLRVSGTGANPPFHFLDADGGQAGIAMDILTAVAADLGLTLEIVPVFPLADMPAALAAGTVDIYAGNITMTAARREQMAFTVPWYQGVGEGVWVLKTDTTDYQSLADFEGQIVGAQRGSATAAGLENANAGFAEIRLFDSQDALAEAVKSGEVKAAFLPRDTSAYVLFEGNYPELQVPASYRGTINVGTPVGFPLALGNTELADRVSSSMAKLMVNGTMTAIFAGYGLTWPLAAR